MKTKAWTGSADAGYIEDVLTLSSKIKMVTENSTKTMGLIYAVYMMQSLAEDGIAFTAFDEDGKEIAMHNTADGKIVAKAELHEAISSMYFVINRERGAQRAAICEELELKYGIKLDAAPQSK